MAAPAEPHLAKVHWTNSLLARIVALCMVLTLCLLGSVYVLTVHFLGQVSKEVESEMLDMLSEAKVQLGTVPANVDELKSALQQLKEQHPGTSFSLAPSTVAERTTYTSAEITDDGIAFTAHNLLNMPGGQPYELVFRFTMKPRDAVYRAFTNRYMIALTIAFLISLSLMLYLIVKSLRPLRDLAKSCAQIGAGDFAPVEIKRNYGEVLALEQTFNKMVGALRDKEQLEANLRQAQRLSALGSLAAGIAHDVRNPLNAIKLLSSHALDNLKGQERENGASQQLQTIRDEVNRLEEIVSGFLALARERELQPEAVKVDTLVAECVHLVKTEAETHGVSLTSEFGAGGLQIDVDPKQVKRAVLNVVINAIEACFGGGRVRVFTRTTEDSYQIEVRDNGPGLTRDVAERAFDPYFTTKPAGTGIGLSITRGIFEEHGGSVSLSSTLGEGCHVLMELPLRQKAAV